MTFILIYGILPLFDTRPSQLNGSTGSSRAAQESHAMIISLLPPAIANLDFSRLRQKLMDPTDGLGLSLTELDKAEREYRRFLAMHKHHPSAPLVPNRLVDAFWHAHILDTQRYSTDCLAVFGYVLHHDPYVGIDGPESVRVLESMFAQTKALYESLFGPYPSQELEAMRCKGHACHVPTPCACRVPGACTSRMESVA